METYRASGVDLDGAARHVESIAGVVTSTWGTNVVGGFGGFAAGVEVPDGYRQPILMMTTDGVGTKLELARRSNRWEGVGHDLVAMCLDDLAAVGAAPLGFVDYMAVGSLHADRDRTIVSSIASACSLAGCPLLGGETAEHPGVMEPDAVDLAGAALGVVEKGEQLAPDRVSAGDLVIGLRSPNLRSNGFSLVRSVLGDEVDAHMDTLLEASVIYSPAVLQAVATGEVGSAAHITGGGIAENLARALPDGHGATIETGLWEPPGVYALIGEHGVERDELFATFNMGIGFCLVVPPEAIAAVSGAVADHSPVVIGEVRTGSGVTLA